METPRQQKLARTIQQALSEIFQKDNSYWFEESLVTLTQVQMTADLGLAKIYLSVLPEKQALETVKRFQERSSEVRNLLGRRIRNKVRNVPNVGFYLDDSAAYAARINNILSGLDIPKEEE